MITTLSMNQLTLLIIQAIVKYVQTDVLYMFEEQLFHMLCLIHLYNQIAIILWNSVDEARIELS